MKKKIIAKILIIVLLCTTTPVFASNNEAGNITSIGIGDYVQLGSYYGEPIVWRCVDIDENGPLMLSDKVISLKAFDAAGSNGGNDNSSSHTRDSGSSAHYRKQHGSNLWADSTLRTWLNSTETEGTVEYPCGNPPVANGVEGGFNAYDTEAGFLSSNNFTKNELNLIKEVKNVSVVNETDKDIATLGSERHIDSFDLDKCLSNYDTAYKLETTDRIFCLNIPQLLNAEKNIADIIYAHPTQTAVSRSEYKSDDLSDTKIWAYWLRDAMPANSVRTHVRNAGWEDKHVYFCWANDDIHLGVRPAFYLSTRDFSNIKGSGTNNDPFICNGDSAVEDETPKDFNYYTFRANWLISDNKDAAYINYRLGLETLTNQMVTALQEKESFGNGLKAWESFELFFSQLDKGPIGALSDRQCKKKDVYQAIILDALHITLQEDVLDRCEEEYKNAIANSQVVLNSWKSTIGDLNDKEVFKKLSIEQKKALGNDLIDNIDLTDDIVDGAKWGLDFINAGIELADCFDALCEQIYSGIMMIEMTDALKNVVRKLYLNCPNEQYHLKDAIKSCVDVMELSVDQFLNKVRNDKIASLGKDAVVILPEQLWECVKKVLQTSFPWVDLLVSAYNTGKMLSNQLFNTEDVVEQYFHMVALVEYELIMDKTLNQFRKEYIGKKNTVNAENYLNAVDLTFSFKNLDCKDANEFVDKIGKGLVNELIYDKKEYADLKGYYKDFQTKIKYAYAYYRLKWIEDLKVEYPDLYPKYSDSKDEILKSVEVACPVNVFVYDKGGALVAYVEDGKAWSSNKVTLQVEKDKKNIYFYDEEEYKINYIGNDSGTMDISILEYDKNKKEVRNACFYELPLQEGKKYEGTIDGKVLQKNEYVIAEGNTSIYSDIDTLLDEGKGVKHTAKIKNGYFSSESSISLENVYLTNQKASIRAVLPKGMEFVKWTSDAGNIFEDETAINTTFIMPNKDVAIKAQFTTNSGGNTPSGNIPAIENKIINAKNSVGGNISPVGKLQVKSGSKQTFTITPDPGYEIADVLVDGKSVGAVSSYTFENVTSDHTISATFKKKEDKDPEADALAKKIKAAKNVKIKASSSQGVNKKGRRYIKVKWTKKGAAVTGYQVYRSFKKKSGFKKFYTTKKKYYYNTKALRKGKCHYYKVRSYTVINGKKYYSKWSNLAYRTVKR